MLYYCLHKQPKWDYVLLGKLYNVLVVSWAPRQCMFTLYNVKELYLVVVGLKSYLLNKLSATGLEWVRDLDMQMSPILTPSSPTDKDTQQGKISILALDQTI